MSMRVIPPLSLTTAMLTSSTVAEPAAGETVWSGATTYALNDEAINTTTHRKFVSLQAGNLNHALPVWPEKTSLWWQDIGPTKRWAMFDLLRNTSTTGTSTLTVVISPGVRVDSLAVRGIVGTSISVTMTSGASTVYSYTKNLQKRNTRSWSNYFFGTFETQTRVTLFDLPPYAGAQITVTITNSAGNAGCSALVVGRQVSLGDVLAEPESDVRNYSTINRDDDGTAEMVPEKSIPILISSVVCAKEDAAKIFKLRESINGLPAIWYGIPSDTDGYADLIDVLGPYTRFVINMKSSVHAITSLQLENI